METFSFVAPVQVTFGPGAVATLGDQVRALGRRVLVVTGQRLLAAGIVEQVTSVLARAGLEVVLFAGVEENPRDTTCMWAAEVCRQEGCAVVLGLGGGSPMDAAKLAACLAVDPGRAPRDLEGRDRVERDPLPLVLVPTTAGSGSEVSFNAVITDSEQTFKFTVSSPRLAARLAVVDPLLTLGKPPELTAATGMDALTHAIESYTNRSVHPIADTLAVQAIRLIGGALRTAVMQGQDRQARSDLLLGSLLAGMAFNFTRLGLVHAMSHPVSAHFGVPHGLANAILLPPVMEYNLSGALERTAEVGRLLGENTAGLPPVEAGRRAVAAVRRLAADVGIPRRLQDVGVRSDRIAAMARDAMKSGNIAVNPRQVCLQDVVELYAQLVD